MKIVCLVILMFAMSCSGPMNNKPDIVSPATTPSYSKNDLGKIKWIEGKWKGLYKGQPFYEFYRFSNDSTIEITSFEWDGKDSSNTSFSYVHFKDGAYYLGDQKYKAITISDQEILMIPQMEANNKILWKYRDSIGWDAILTGSKETLVYHMEYFDPFKK